MQRVPGLALSVLLLACPAGAVPPIPTAHWNFGDLSTGDRYSLFMIMPGHFHPVLADFSCSPFASDKQEAATIQASVEADKGWQEGATVPLRIRAGHVRIRTEARWEPGGPDGIWMEYRIPQAHPLWAALATADELVFTSPAHDTPLRIPLETIRGPLRSFLAFCGFPSNLPGAGRRPGQRP